MQKLILARYLYFSWNETEWCIRKNDKLMDQVSFVYRVLLILTESTKNHMQKIIDRTVVQMSHLMTKPTKWLVRPVKTRIRAYTSYSRSQNSRFGIPYPLLVRLLTQLLTLLRHMILQWFQPKWLSMALCIHGKTILLILLRLLTCHHNNVSKISNLSRGQNSCMNMPTHTRTWNIDIICVYT